MAFTNSTSLLQAPQDLLLALPRLLQNSGAYALSYLPDQFDNFFAMMRGPGTMIAARTSTLNASMASITSTLLPSPAAVAKTHSWTASMGKVTGGNTPGGMDGVLGYFASRWAVSTFIIAIILNRARVYSASRRRLSLRWHTRLFLRVWPILLFAQKPLLILQTLRCQTGDLLKHPPDSKPQPYNSLFTGEGGALYTLSSLLLSWQSEADSCTAANMLPQHERAIGSSSILWPMFLGLCLGHLVETISCALEGRTPVPETAMSVFEHSLAFAEAEFVVRRSAGLGVFGPLKIDDPKTKLFASLTHSMVLQRLNVPPEVLLIALISSCSHLSTHTLAILGLQSRFRLVNTTVWGVSFLSAFLWNLFRYAALEPGSDAAFLRYPLVCLVGFMPHIMIVGSILACTVVYVLALVATVLSPPTTRHFGVNWKDRLRMANDNLQASIALSSVHLRWSDEFFTTLLKVGFKVLTAASEAVYFNEGISVAISRSTWLEGKCLQEIGSLQTLSPRKLLNIPTELEGASDVANGLNLVDSISEMSASKRPTSGFANERKTAKAGAPGTSAAMREEGVGAAQRSSRGYLSFTLLREDFILLARIAAKATVRLLDRVKPELAGNRLRSFAYQHAPPKGQSSQDPQNSMDRWVMSDDPALRLPTSPDLDVEVEFRKQLAQPQFLETPIDLDDCLYGWWKEGGSWGELDSSGHYQPSIVDEDVTSLISNSTYASDIASQDWESEDEGQKTPTQQWARKSSVRSLSAEPEDLLGTITRLLDPESMEDKAEARMLAMKLKRSTPMTRSQYRREQELGRLRLVAGRSHILSSQKMTPHEEEEQLERLIMHRRKQALDTKTQPWSEGGDGLGAGGPQCVICQSAPRTILVWPCRCLCVCEDCRVSLALNNFTNCVTCRRDVVAFSRLFVP